MKRSLCLIALTAIIRFSYGQTTLTVDGSGNLNVPNIVTATTAGQSFFTGRQLGSGYAYNVSAIFHALTDNPNGAQNYFFDGATNGTLKYFVRADGQGYFAGSVGIGSASPTHSLTFASTATGIALYKTSDQTTNYERLIAQLQGNVFTIGSYFGGSGTQPRAIQIGIQAGPGTTTLSSGRVFTINPVTGTMAGVFDFFNTTAVAGSVVTVNTNMLGASVQQNMLAIEGTVNQTGSSGYRGLFVSPYLQGTGSGSKLLIDAGTNSAASGSGTHTSKFMVDDTGNGYFAGNVGIGITNPQEALSVNGTVHSKAVKIDLIGWPDFVFDKIYKLPSLQSVKTYIDINHHLPDVPSANEMVTHGLDVGEMNKLLMKKVEELTLYLIQQKDNSDRISNKQQLKIDSQEQRIKRLEQLLLRQQQSAQRADKK